MILKRNPDIYKNAYPNWQKSFRTFDGHFVLYSNQFKESADKLIDFIGENHGHIADTLINPAIFLYRHSIELCLKGILHKIYLDAGIDIEKIKEKLNGHSLESLWSKVYNEITGKYIFINDDKSKNELKKLEKY